SGGVEGSHLVRGLVVLVLPLLQLFARAWGEPGLPSLRSLAPLLGQRRRRRERPVTRPVDRVPEAAGGVMAPPPPPGALPPLGLVLPGVADISRALSRPAPRLPHPLPRLRPAD